MDTATEPLVPAREMKKIEARLEHSASLPKYEIVIKPKPTDPQVKSLLPNA